MIIKQEVVQQYPSIMWSDHYFVCNAKTIFDHSGEYYVDISLTEHIKKEKSNILDMQDALKEYCITTMSFKGTVNPKWQKYVLIEELLTVLSFSSSYNKGDFDNNDANMLIDLYVCETDDLKKDTAMFKNAKNELIDQLRCRYKEVLEEYRKKHRSDRKRDSLIKYDLSNFKKMIKSDIKYSRRPNIHLINALADVFIRGV